VDGRPPAAARRGGRGRRRGGKLRDEGKSLLPIGMTEVQGDFARGDVIAVRTGRGRGDRARPGQLLGAEARLIARKPSAQIEACWAMPTSPR
jgi:glutamate 5-kinase